MDFLAVHRSETFADADFLVCIVPAVSLGRPRAGGLPPGCSDMGPGPPRRGLLHPFCRHLSGEQALATEGTNGGVNLIQICSADQSCRVLIFEDDAPRGGDGAGVHRRHASAVQHAAVCHPQIAVCYQVKRFSFVGSLVE